jgi:hypothetical protein
MTSQGEKLFNARKFVGKKGVQITDEKEYKKPVCQCPPFDQQNSQLTSAYWILVDF